MAAAFQAAINTCRKGGGVIRWGATAPYLIDQTLDCTFSTSANQFGLHFQDEGSTSGDGFPPGPSIIFKHTGYGFDLTYRPIPAGKRSQRVSACRLTHLDPAPTQIHDPMRGEAPRAAQGHRCRARVMAHLR